MKILNKMQIDDDDELILTTFESIIDDKISSAMYNISINSDVDLGNILSDLEDKGLDPLVLLAFSGQELIGFLLLASHTEELIEFAKYEIYSIIIDEERRNKYLGSVMIEYIIEFLSSIGDDLKDKDVCVIVKSDEDTQDFFFKNEFIEHYPSILYRML